jgi:glycosyltransferase involved in cell wall biosynthesis
MALKTRNDYVLYIVGKVYSKEGQEKIDYLQKNYPVEYLGGFNPPSHLNFLKYAYMGVLPYKPVKSQSSDELNALYCAPNKIFEYAGFGVPMIGSDVMGLKLPFEQWNIGCCYDDNSIESIMDAIDYVEKKYETMTEQCIEFYNSVDLNKIICGIIGGHYEN